MSPDDSMSTPQSPLPDPKINDDGSYELDWAAQELPIEVPEVDANDEIACILSVGEPDDPSEAWEYLDPVLNRLLGYGSSLEDIARCVRYGITVNLLEGKLEALSKAIELLKETPTTTHAPPINHPPQSVPSLLTVSQVHCSSPHLQLLLENSENEDDDIEYIGTLPSASTYKPSPPIDTFTWRLCGQFC
ncbi:hypothetical protein V8E53_004514 [Lactarius tabidus]